MQKFVLTFALCILYAVYAFAQQSELKFTRLTNLDGLSQSTVPCIIKDRYGYMWFGTHDGLNRYDGYKFKVFRHRASDSTSLSANNIKALYEDKQGRIWIGTLDGGLNMYDHSKETFIQVKADANNPEGLSNNGITAINGDSEGNIWVGTYWGLNRLNPSTMKFERFLSIPDDISSLSHSTVHAIKTDSKGNLWVGTEGGLNLFVPKTKTFKSYVHDKNKPTSISGNHIRAIQEDVSGNLWIGTNDGLNLFDYQKGTFTHYGTDPGNPTSISSNEVSSIADGGNGRLWVGTAQGLNLLDVQKKKFKNFKHIPEDEGSLGNGSVTALLFDNTGILWIGTYSGGVNKYDQNLTKFKLFRHNSSNYETLSMNVVTSFAESSDGNIWLGTDGGSLNLFNRTTQKFTRFFPNPEDKNSIASWSVLALLNSKKDNTLWIGTYGSGVEHYDPKTNIFKHYTQGDAPTQLNNSAVYALMEDRRGNVWMGTNGGGVNILDVKTQLISKLRHDTNNPNSLSNDYVRAFYEDKQGNVWVGTVGGIAIYNPSTQNFTRLDKDNSKLSSNFVLFIFEDSKSNIWVGTLGGGLNRYMPKSKSFSQHGDGLGLNNTTINYITEDEQGYLWLSSNNGVTRLNPQTKEVKKYNLFNGLQSFEFITGAGLRAKDGEIFLGGINGFNIIDTKALVENNNLPLVAITGFMLANKPVQIGAEDSPLQQAIGQTKEITLNYDQSVITFEYTAFSYTVPEQNQYAYMLDGFDTQWNYVGNKQSATYTNLDPGEYTFRVKASNNDGVWNEQEATIKLIITPPYWMTWWFRGIILAVVVGSFVAFYLYRIRAIKKQKLLLEQQVQERTSEVVSQKEEIQHKAARLTQLNLELLAQKAQEHEARKEAENARKEAEKANQAKSVFLATMSHEIRTPLNGVIGMTSLLAETKLDPEQRKFTQIITASGKNLLSVINDILDFSKIESGKMELDQHTFNLRESIEEVLDMFAGKAAEQNLDLMYQLEHNIPLQVIGDSTRLKQILINLVGNALKFTSSGEIFVGVKMLRSLENNQLELGFEVRDTGIGIPSEKAQHLFTAFSQVDSSTTRKYGGTGLGLAICKRLVTMMGGQIKVESVPGEGTSFLFTIVTQASSEPYKTYVHSNISYLEGKRVLVVDDNETNRSILEGQLLQWKYRPQLVASGEEALQLLQDQPFDLVVSDMQMPEMDGVELAKRIKEHHPELPVVLLSSMGNELKPEQRALFYVVLTKPVKQLELYKYVTDALKQARKTDVTEQPELQPVEPQNKKLSTTFAAAYPLQILVAEDYPINQLFAEMVLEKLGYQFELAENGLQVLEALNRKTYDVILMDVQMPEMDGLEATRLIRAKAGRQPYIVATTANVIQEDVQACINAGMDNYISKPIDLDELMKILERAAELVSKPTPEVTV
ncbi:hybrid sensor histidine kinase/response regulator [Pontibacter harenae]|uniref:hybrid sensor histidine kinase/response regulator n=1 Tax=Pontibacter harenae TaxID=2894083 RepID=UPI001E41C967|nr:hybrid sensor histidine kinase/response regulator [Pontibacter harenae]MCC9166925.1 response regulator [Pontibacter harenae]